MEEDRRLISCHSELELKNLIKQGNVLVYFYTPMCGTCELANQFLTLVEPLFDNVTIYKCNLSYFTNLSIRYEIQSVPCAILFRNGTVLNKIYAFQSVTNIYEQLQVAYQNQEGSS